MPSPRPCPAWRGALVYNCRRFVRNRSSPRYRPAWADGWLALQPQCVTRRRGEKLVCLHGVFVHSAAAWGATLERFRSNLVFMVGR